MIQLQGLTKVYDLLPGAGASSQVVAADHLDLEIASGEVFGLVGPNGAGKTTTLRMICGLLSPTAGRVLVNGVDVERQPEDAQRSIGYLSDFFGVYDDLKVWEYLDYFAHAYKMEPEAIPVRIDHALQVMGLEEKAHEFISGLSRGMKQRLGIARAILHDPPVLVLDEPAVGLDPNARLELKQFIKGLHRDGKTIFITSHLLADLEEMCTSVGIMERGRLLRVGSIEQILRETAGGRTIVVRLASSGFPLDEWLRARSDVSGVLSEPQGVRFVFGGGDGELAALVRDMVVAGAPVCGLEEVTETLEQAFSRLSRGAVM